MLCKTCKGQFKETRLVRGFKDYHCLSAYNRCKINLSSEEFYRYIRMLNDAGFLKVGIDNEHNLTTYSLNKKGKDYYQKELKLDFN